MSKSLSYILFIVFFAAFSINWLLQRNGIHVPVLHAYMDDFICVPVVLFPVLLIYRKWIAKSDSYVLPIGYIISTCLILSLVFEIVLPIKNTNHTSDPMDMFLYGIGGVLFWFMQKPFAISREETQVC